MHTSVDSGPKVKVKLVKGSIVVGDRVHPAGVTVEVDESVGIRLADEGGATFAPGVTLSGDGRALQAELAGLKGKPPKPRPDAPTVKVRCISLDAPDESQVPRTQRNGAVGIFAGHVVRPGDTVEAREDDAALGMAVRLGSFALAPGSAFTPRGMRYYDRVAAGQVHATY